MNTKQKNAAYALLAASVLGIITVFLPWYTIAGESLVPFSVSTGKILLVLGALSLLMAAGGLWKAKRVWGIMAIIFGLLFTLVVFANYPSKSALGAGASLVKVEPGFYLSLLSGILMIAFGGWKTATK